MCPEGALFGSSSRSGGALLEPAPCPFEILAGALTMVFQLADAVLPLMSVFHTGVNLVQVEIPICFVTVGCFEWCLAVLVAICTLAHLVFCGDCQCFNLQMLYCR